MSKKMVFKKTWGQFRNTGLLFFINQTLHVFGWAIVVSYKSYDRKSDTGVIEEVYPARVKFRGFSKEAIDRGYKKVTKYMKDNIKRLYKDTLE